MSQALYVLPEGWAWKRLGDVCTFENGDRGKNYPSRDAFVDSGVAVINAGALNGKTLDGAELNFITRERFELLGSGKVKRGDLLFCLRGSLGKCAIVTDLDEGAIASSLVIVRPTESLLAEYLLNYFNSGLVVQFITQYNNGAAQPNLSAANLAKFELPLPPLAEQIRIVDKLDAVLSRIDTAIDELQQSLALVDAMFKSGLDKAFNPLGSQTNEADLYDLPDGWVWVSFESLMYVKGGKRLPKDTGFQEEKTMFPYIRVSDFNDKGGINLSDLKYISEDVHNLIKNYTISSSDLYISIAGTIGKTGIVPESLNGANLTENAAKLVIKDASLLVLKYLYLFTLSNVFSEQAGLATKQVAQPKLALSRLSAINIPLPPLAEQNRIVEALDALNDKTSQLKTALTAKIDMFNQLKASVLDGTFRGLI